MFFKGSIQFIVLLAVFAMTFAEKFEIPSNVTASACVCTTVPCPVAGNNYLTVGKFHK